MAPDSTPPPTVSATKPSFARKRMRRRNPEVRTADPSRWGVKPCSAGSAVALSSVVVTACWAEVSTQRPSPVCSRSKWATSVPSTA